MGSASSSFRVQDPPVGFNVSNMPPLWAVPRSHDGSNTNIQTCLQKYDKEYVSTTLAAQLYNPQYQLCIDTQGRKLVLRLGDQVLGVAKKSGKTFWMFRVKPAFEGQKPGMKLKRLANSPLFLHTKVKRTNNKISVSQFHNVIYNITKGPKNSFEHTCTCPNSGEDVATWRYKQHQNHIEIFQSTGGTAVDVGLLLLCVVIADIFDADSTMDKAAVMAVVGGV